ncbi:MAG: DUF5615 family PIN-like protein [Ginsengibacter sp.]
MYLLDENITRDQRELLERWHFQAKQVGVDFGVKGIKDEQIVTLLQQTNGILFITRDSDFFKKEYCHSKYCIVFLDLGKYEVAYFIRKFLKHPLFNSSRKRMGKVIKINQTFIQYYNLKSDDLITLNQN